MLTQFMAAMWVLTPMVPASSGDEVARRAAAILSDSDYQTILPQGATAETPRRSAAPEGSAKSERSDSEHWRVPSSSESRSRRRPPPVVKNREVMGDVMTWLLYIGGGVLVLLLGAAALRKHRNRPEVIAVNASITERRDEQRVAGLTDGQSLAAIESLVDQGLYSEAVYALLHHTLDTIFLTRGVAFAASMTSREILNESGLVGRQRQALGHLVFAAEAVHFGGVLADVRAYEDCLNAFQTLLSAVSGEAS